MFKTLLFLIILILGAYFTYNIFKPSFFSKTKIVHIKADNLQYKSIPDNQEGFNFIGEDLSIYNVIREKILPKEDLEDKKKVIVNSKLPVIEQKNTKIEDNIITNFYLQLASYKNIEKAKELIFSYKESSNLILNKLNFNIATAKIKDRGTYYRVRVGPFSNVKEIYKLCLVFKVKDNECLIVKDK
ncbi:MAG: hypothetical protein CMJ05_06565 [Pelagibacterales bacterium]|nr:hypothetical protein [Pelagibacterales bacterium]